MRTHLILSALALNLILPMTAAYAAPAKITLTVHHAGCVLCGPIVKSTLEHVKGVSAVSVSQPDGLADVTAIVAYDDVLASSQSMIKATTDQGYPAEVSQQGTN